jgi:hypothetical protein
MVWTIRTGAKLDWTTRKEPGPTEKEDMTWTGLNSKDRTWNGLKHEDRSWTGLSHDLDQMQLYGTRTVEPSESVATFSVCIFINAVSTPQRRHILSVGHIHLLQSDLFKKTNWSPGHSKTMHSNPYVDANCTVIQQTSSAPQKKLKQTWLLWSIVHLRDGKKNVERWLPWERQSASRKPAPGSLRPSHNANITTKKNPI